MSIEAMKHYEAALLKAFPRGATGDVFEHWNKARQAIAEAEKQEPVAWMYDFLNTDNRDEVIRNWTTQDYADIEREKGFNVRPLYTHPPKKQEPHSWYSAEHDEWMTNKTRKEHEALNSYTHKVGGFDLPLYTTPPQREWVGLTDEEWVKELGKVREQVNGDVFGGFYCAIEAKLKEKNHG